MPAPPRQPSRAAGPVRRIHLAWTSLAPEQRVAALAGLVLWVSMFLPWYSKVVAVPVRGSLSAASYSLSAFGAFSFVEAAVLLVASSVLVLLFARAERRAFHLPGGDGGVILVAGVWTSLLVFYRMLDKPGTAGNAQLTTTIGLQWGIFVAVGAAIALAYAGTRLRAAHRPEPTRVEDPTLPTPGPPDRPRRRREAPGRGRSTDTTETEQLSLEVEPTTEEQARPDPPRRRRPPLPDSDGVPEYDPFGERRAGRVDRPD